MSHDEGFIDEVGSLVDAMNRAEQEKKAPKSPDAQAADILERLWNREGAEESPLTHQEALVLLLYGDDAGEQTVEAEIEYGRYEPDADVQVLLDKKRAQSNPPPIQ